MAAMMPPASAPKSGSLYVGDLPQDMPNPEDTLFNMFSKVGMVMSIKVCRDINSQRSLGYAYVNFQNPQDAEAALERLNFAEIRPGRPIRIMWSIRDPAQRKNGNGNIFVKNLDPSIDARTLRDTFHVFGAILSCKIATNESGGSLGYGFVHFEKDESASEAIARVNGMHIGGREVSVTRFVKKAEREREEEKVFTNVYVKNLRESTTEEELRAFLTAVGPVSSIFLGGAAQYRTKFALVAMTNHEHALELIDKYNGHPCAMTEPDQKLYVARALKKRDRQAQKARTTAANLYQSQGRNLYVKHLDDSVTDEQLEDLFKPYGTVTSCKLMKDPDGTSRGFGFVCYLTKESAQAAIREMNGKMIFRRPLYVSQAQNKDMRHHMLEEQRKTMMAQQQRMMSMPMHGQFWGAPMNNFMAGRPLQQLNFPVPMGAPGGFGMPVGGPMRGGLNGPRPGANRTLRTPQQFAAPPAGFPPAGFPAPMPRYTQPAAPPPRPVTAVSGISSTDLSKMSHEEQKNALGERLYVKIQEINPHQAAKITGMLLEMDTPEILNVLEDHAMLVGKVNEAVAVLRQHADRAS